MAPSVNWRVGSAARLLVRIGMNEVPEAIVPGSSRMANHENESDNECYSAHSQQGDASGFGGKQRRQNGQKGEKHDSHP